MMKISKKSWHYWLFELMTIESNGYSRYRDTSFPCYIFIVFMGVIFSPVIGFFWILVNLGRLWTKIFPPIDFVE